MRREEGWGGGGGGGGCSWGGGGSGGCEHTDSLNGDVLLDVLEISGSIGIKEVDFYPHLVIYSLVYSFLQRFFIQSDM